MDDIGLFMDPQFQPKQKDNVFVKKPITYTTVCGNYCMVMFENLLQIYSICKFYSYK